MSRAKKNRREKKQNVSTSTRHHHHASQRSKSRIDIKRTHLDHLAELDGLLSGRLEIIDRENLHAGLVNQLASLLHVGALETSNDGNLEVERLDGVDQAVSDGIATNDTAENVDKDGGDLGIASNKLKSLLDSSRGSTATNIKEISRLTAVKLDDIHGGHGKTGAVNQAADITIKLDEVQARLGSANLLGVLLGGVAPLKDLLLTEIGIVIETELCIHAHDLVVRGLGKGVDLDLGGVLLKEDLVKLLDGVLGILDALVAKAELGSDASGDFVSDANVDVNVGRVNSVRVLLGDTLNVDTALGRGNDNGTLRGAVHEDGKVELAAGKLALANVDGAAETALGASLLGDELVADHLLGEHPGLGGGVDNADTALEAVVEGTLATAAGENLSLDHHVLTTNILCDGLGLGGSRCDGALGNIDAILFIAGVCVSCVWGRC